MALPKTQFRTVSLPDRNYMVDVSKIAAEKKVSVYLLNPATHTVDHAFDAPCEKLPEGSAFRNFIISALKQQTAAPTYRTVTTRAGQFLVDVAKLAKEGKIAVLTVDGAGKMTPFAEVKCDKDITDNDLRSFVVKQINIAVALLKAQTDYKASKITLSSSDTVIERNDLRKLKPTENKAPGTKRRGIAWTVNR